MTSRDFVYWLQGYFEVYSASFKGTRSFPEYKLDEKQVQVIRNHLNMVFKHEIDPSFGDKAHQEELTKAHEGIDYQKMVEARAEQKKDQEEQSRMLGILAQSYKVDKCSEYFDKTTWRHVDGVLELQEEDGTWTKMSPAVKESHDIWRARIKAIETKLDPSMSINC